MIEPLPSVVLIHGLAANSIAMLPLRVRLSRMGFDAMTWSYPSMRSPIIKHADRFRRFLDGLDQAGKPYHIVAHSMGSIVTRAAIRDSAGLGLRRVVLLAPPNLGLAAARRAPYWIKRFCRPMDDLADVPESFVNTLPQVLPVDVGVIAARGDILIPIEKTHVSGQRDHTVVAGSHNSLLLSSHVASLVRRFLNSGEFDEQQATSLSTRTFLPGKTRRAA